MQNFWASPFAIGMINCTEFSESFDIYHENAEDTLQTLYKFIYPYLITLYMPSNLFAFLRQMILLMTVKV